MGVPVGPTSFAPITVDGEMRLTRRPKPESHEDRSLDPLIRALGRAVERSQTPGHKETREGQN